MRLPFARSLATLLAVGITFLGMPAAWSASNPKAVALRIKCGLHGVNGTPDTVGCPLLLGSFDGRLDWASNGVTVFQEFGPFSGTSIATDEVLIFADGNGDETTFNTVYEDPTTSIFMAPDLTFRLYATDRRGALRLVTEQRFMPVAAALWAKHSEDAAMLQADIETLRQATLTIDAGRGLAGGGAVAVGGSTTIENTGVLSVIPGPGISASTNAGSVTVAIPDAGISNSQLANPSIMIAAGPGLTGGGTVQLGGTTLLALAAGAIANSHLANSAVTINAGGGLAGGGTVSLGGALNLMIPPGGVTNSQLTNSMISVIAGAGLTGGGTVPLGGTTAISLAPDGMTTTHILDGTIQSADLAPGSVTATKLATGAVGTAAIQDGAVTAAKLDPALSGLRPHVALADLSPLSFTFQNLFSLPGRVAVAALCVPDPTRIARVLLAIESGEQQLAVSVNRRVEGDAQGEVRNVFLVLPARSSTDLASANADILSPPNSNLIQGHIELADSVVTFSALLRFKGDGTTRTCSASLSAITSGP